MVELTFGITIVVFLSALKYTTTIAFGSCISTANFMHLESEALTGDLSGLPQRALNPGSVFSTFL